MSSYYDYELKRRETEDMGGNRKLINPPLASDQAVREGFERVLYDLEAADLLYENLRDGGMSHAEARAKVEEFLRPTP